MYKEKFKQFWKSIPDGATGLSGSQLAPILFEPEEQAEEKNWCYAGASQEDINEMIFGKPVKEPEPLWSKE